MNVRPMQPQDIPGVASWMVEMPLYKRYGVTESGANDQFQQAMQQGDLLLVAGSPPCAFAWCMRDGGFGRSAYLRLIGVRPDCAGQGMGAALLVEVEAQVESRDLFLLVSDFNEGAQHFYQHMGYEQVGAIPGYVLPDVTELVFRKRLH